ncbi:acetolactate decarboxylase [Levilactobacillus zymae]|uniref:acetolactate decarboxylase n=1 Tax=Levilactobacillus zymae TaxID=267363 RepID=UPI0028B3356D|nr:acetolactate decarboxylase [Levilactobacillus zymae]MDT6980896.1 acetolactate decarboxylase [Levilactobacillus zymae]
MSNTTTLYQHGTLALLVPGLLDGTITMQDLLAHGDTGIGTGEGLDGELIILEGTPYQVDSHGQVNLVSADFTLPFANSHFAAYQPLMTVENARQADLPAQIMAETRSANTFFSVKITGTFTQMRTRAVQKSAQPYQSLAKTAATQRIFTRETVTGTLLSYYSPQIFDGVAVGGFHSHFMSADHDFGGHILDFATVDGEITWQQFDSLAQHLPTQSAAYMAHDFSQDDILGAIHQAE